MCVVVKAVPCSLAPSPNDQIQVAPTADELTPNVSGTPMVAFADTLRNANGKVGVGFGVGVAGVVATRGVWALTVPATAVTSAVSDAVSVAVAAPPLLVATCDGDTVPRVVVNVTMTLAKAPPLAFCTRAVTTAVPPAFRFRRCPERDLRGHRRIDSRHACLGGVVIRTSRPTKQREQCPEAQESHVLDSSRHCAIDTAVVPVVIWPVVSRTVTVTVNVPVAV